MACVIQCLRLSHERGSEYKVSRFGWENGEIAFRNKDGKSEIKGKINSFL